MFEIDNLEEVAQNIQPFVSQNKLFTIYIVASLVSLFLYAIVVASFNKNMVHSFTNLINKEQETYKFFLTLPEKQYVQTLVLYAFSAIQFAYIILNKNTEQTIVNSLIMFFTVFSVLLVKETLYNTLKQLLSNKVNIGYFLFNYQTIVLYMSLFLLPINILETQGTIVQTNYNLIFIISVVICYILLISRIILIAMRFKFIRSFYFFLYLCTLEIVPILLGMKIVDIL